MENVISALLAVVLIWGVGCRGKGPRFDPVERSAQLGSADMLDGYAAELMFREFKGTNGLPAEDLMPPKEFFHLGPGDQLRIEILGDAGSANTVTVGPDGKIYYSLLPGLMVWGLTLTEAKELIQRNLLEYIRIEPEVSLVLEAVASQRVWILGNVDNPGVYVLNTPKTVLEAITLAGGTLRSGSSEELVDWSNSFILREGKYLDVDFHALFRQGDMKQNIYLKANDYVYLRPAVSRDLYVFGAVSAPNVYPYNKTATVISAIAAAGGPVDYAHLSQVAIVRGSLSNPQIATVDYHDMARGVIPNLRLEPGDVVYVPLRPWYKLEVLGDSILQQIVRTIAINEGNASVIEGGRPVTPTVSFGDSN